MTVAELIEFLKTQQQDLPVCYRLHSEQCLLQAVDIGVKHLQPARFDDWVHNHRPDRESIPYLVFPGN